MDEDKEMIQRLIQDLGIPDYRKWAFEKLVKIGRPALPQLVEALKDKKLGVREKAAELLGKIGDEREIPAFIEALKDGERFSEVGPTACHALAKIGEPAVPHLIGALNDKDVRYRAVGILGDIAEKRAVDILRNFAEKEVDCSAAIPVLIDFLKHGNSNLRWTTALALGKIGDVRAVPALIAALEDEDLGVRRRAVEALGKIIDKCGKVDSVVSALCGAMKDNDEVVRRYASEELNKIGDGRAVSALVDALNVEADDFLQSKFDKIINEILDKSVVERDHPATLKIIKILTWDIRRKYEGKNNIVSLKEKREKLAKLESLTQQIHDKMNSDKKTFPVKRQEVKKPPARFLRT